MSAPVNAFKQSLDRLSIEHLTAYLMDVGGYQTRHVHGVIKSKSPEEVELIVRLANEHKISLYPYSTGKNWGFGSRIPIKSDAFLIDLTGMNRIISIDMENGIAEIEPGVTQSSLASALEGSPWILNVTSAGGNTSILGNALENGVGIYRKRVEEIVGINAILGNQEHVVVHQETNADAFYLSVTDFIQSNFSIVTSARIALITRPEELGLVSLVFSDDDLESVLQQCKTLLEQSCFSGIPKIFNREYGQYQLIAATQGNGDDIHQKVTTIAGVLPSTARFYFSNEPPDDELIQSQLDLYAGIPCDRAAKRYVMKAGAPHDLDAFSYLGIRLFCVIIPFETNAIQWTLELLRNESSDPVDMEFTFNLWSADQVGLVVYIHFARNESGIQAAQRTQQRLYEIFWEKRYLPYRYDIDHMDRYSVDHPTDNRRKSELKNQFDPNGIISPGKYG